MALLDVLQLHGVFSTAELPLGQEKLINCFASVTCVRVLPDRWSLFVASKYYTHSVQTYVATAATATKSGRVMALKVIMTVEVSGLK